MKIRSHDELIRAVLKAYAVCVPILYLPLGGAAVSFVDLAAPFALVYLALRGLSSLNYIYVIFLLYAAVAVLSVILSPLRTAGFLELLLAARLVFISLPFWLAAALGEMDEEDVHGLYRALLIGAALGVVSGLVLHYLGITVREEQQSFRIGRPGVGAEEIYRAGGVVGGTSAYGQITAIFGILLFMASRVGVPLGLPLRVVGWATVGLAFLVSSSRGGMAMLLAALIVIAVLRPRMLPGFLGIVVAGVITVIGVVTLVGSPEQQAFLWLSIERLDILNLTGESRFGDTSRFDTWASLWTVAFDIPTFGLGYKLVQEHFGVVIDNSFIFAWLETGLVGFILFILFWLVVSWRLFVDYLAHGSPLVQTALGMCAGFVVIMQTFGAHTTWSGAPLVFMLLGLGVREGVMRRREADAGPDDAEDVETDDRGAPVPAE